MLGHLVSLVLLALDPPQQKPPAQATGSVQEMVRVERVVLTGRVIDRFASAIPGLTKSDFRVVVDGKPVVIESVDWIPPELEPVRALPTITVGEAVPADRALAGDKDLASFKRPTAPRTIVMLFQWEVAGQKDRGFIRMMRQAIKMVEASEPDDRIAVLAFGASLRLLQDLTTDHAALRDAIEAIRSWPFRGRSTAATGPTMSAGIASCGPRESIAKAIACIGTSLQPLPGQKTLVFFGWTVGRPQRGPWFVEYPAMVDAISRADTAVYVLDVSDDHHSLEVGLKQLATDTGGLFNGGCIYEMMYCADLARLKTQKAVGGGRYEIVFSDPGAKRGWHEVDVQLTGHGGIPIFHRWYQN